MDETKKCTKCGEVKPFNQYYKRKYKNRFRHRAACKECFNKQVEISRSKPGAKEARRVYEREYMSRPGVKDRRNEYLRDWRSRHYQDLENVKKRQDYLKEYESRPETISMRQEYKKKYNKSIAAVKSRKKSRDKIRKSASDSYIKDLLYKQAKGLLLYEDIPLELIEPKRQSLLLKRTIKQQKNDRQETNV